ncbi:MAG TPA: VOC family protein [Thermoleophilaceae bacterium]|jgi:lactoylglutathione lyase
MRTLHIGLRVAHLERSLAFYAALGYEVVGSVPATSLGDLTMIKLPDDPFVTIELVSRSSAGTSIGGNGLSHFVVKVESMDTVVAELAAAGIHPDEPPKSPDGSDEFRTAWIADPDGNRIELVQWPSGHPDGMTEADFSGA